MVDLKKECFLSLLLFALAIKISKISLVIPKVAYSLKITAAVVPQLCHCFLQFEPMGSL